MTGIKSSNYDEKYMNYSPEQLLNDLQGFDHVHALFTLPQVMGLLGHELSSLFLFCFLVCLLMFGFVRSSVVMCALCDLGVVVIFESFCCFMRQLFLCCLFTLGMHIHHPLSICFLVKY